MLPLLAFIASCFPTHSTAGKKSPDLFFVSCSFNHLYPAPSPNTLIYVMTESYQFYILHISQLCPRPHHPHCCYFLHSDLIFTGTTETVSYSLSLPSTLTLFSSTLLSSDIFDAWNSPLSTEWSANSLTWLSRPLVIWSLFVFPLSSHYFFLHAVLYPTHIKRLPFHASRPSHIVFFARNASLFTYISLCLHSGVSLDPTSFIQVEKAKFLCLHCAWKNVCYGTCNMLLDYIVSSLASLTQSMALRDYGENVNA